MPRKVKKTKGMRKAHRSKIPKHVSFVRANEKTEKYSYATFVDMSGAQGMGAAAASTSLCVSAEYPGYFRSPTGYINLPASPDFTRFNALFDLYRVIRLTVKFDTPFTAEYQGDWNSQIYGPANALAPTQIPYNYLHIDHDDDAQISTEIQALNKGPGHVQSSSHKQVMVMHKDRRNKWFNTSAMNPASVPVTAGTISDQIQNRGSIKFFQALSQPNAYLGRLWCTWDIEYNSLRTI